MTRRASGNPATGPATRTVRDGYETEFETFLQRLQEVFAAAPGHRGLTVIRRRSVRPRKRFGGRHRQAARWLLGLSRLGDTGGPWLGSCSCANRVIARSRSQIATDEQADERTGKWLVDLDFPNANPSATVDVAVGLTLAGSPTRQRADR